MYNKKGVHTEQNPEKGRIFVSQTASFFVDDKGRVWFCGKVPFANKAPRKNFLLTMYRALKPWYGTHTKPVLLSALQNEHIISIAAAGFCAFFVTKKGDVFSCGYGDYTNRTGSVLGHNREIKHSPIPTRIKFFTQNRIKIVGVHVEVFHDFYTKKALCGHRKNVIAHSYHTKTLTYFIAENGKLYSCGYGQGSVPVLVPFPDDIIIKGIACIQNRRKETILKQEVTSVACSSIVSIERKDPYMMFILTKDNRVCLRDLTSKRLTSINFPQGEKITQVVGGIMCCLFLSETGKLYYTKARRGGNNSVTYFDAPIFIETNIKIKEVAIVNEKDGSQLFFVLDKDGNLYNFDSGANRLKKAVTIEGVKQIAGCCSNHVLFLTKRDTVFVWGDNSCGQLGLGHKKKVKRITKIPGFFFEKLRDR